MAAKVCILCGILGRDTPEGQLTREHIWPQWYSDLHPDRWYEVESIWDIRTGATTRRGTKSLDFQPRVLCGDCNHNWGRRLEDRIAPRLAKMTEGESEAVSLPFARLIATWATLKFMAAEHMVRSRRPLPFFMPEQGLYLRTHTRPLVGTALWMGRYAGGRRNAGWLLDARSFRPLKNDPTVVVDRYAVTYSIGQVAIQFLGIRGIAVQQNDPRQGVSLHIPEGGRWDWRQGLNRIWPLPDKAFGWPPPKAFSDKTFKALSRRWHQHSPTGEPRDDPSA